MLPPQSDVGHVNSHFSCQSQTSHPIFKDREVSHAAGMKVEGNWVLMNNDIAYNADALLRV